MPKRVSSEGNRTKTMNLRFLTYRCRVVTAAGGRIEGEEAQSAGGGPASLRGIAGRDDDDELQIFEFTTTPPGKNIDEESFFIEPLMDFRI
ncbi:hypothetical protein Q1695_010169 [Nippostrongylus brasiliensis]|nr:hypothetical protein Q1695_010169 [Nippostrongylus brasiliensis]